MDSAQKVLGAPGTGYKRPVLRPLAGMVHLARWRCPRHVLTVTVFNPHKPMRQAESRTLGTDK